MPSSSTRSPRHDEVLLTSFRAGDDWAVREVVHRFQGPMTTVARSILRDQHRAEDAVQQAFLQAWRAASSFDPARPLAPWLFTITRRVCIDLHRCDERTPVVDLHHDPADADDGSRSLEHAWLRWEVRRALDHLPQEERVVVGMAHLEGLSHREIADRLEVPLGTVKSRSFRAHRRLTALLQHVHLDEDQRRAGCPG